MAVYIEMDKVENTDEYVVYTFGRDPQLGLIRLDKKTEAVYILKECPLDASGRWSEMAAVKLVLLWRCGELPEKTQWAS
ncbi:hypothetical protein HX829_07815 [Pseudomonas gingeri]|jgi:hypothetical protein|uniref:Uncharacterized protein n=1 Tax=Pseudomonas gingeri TaxID=117681 RepID=A0A7Y7WBQ3_9PSED|nr:hypothetical protein [Pseudomonas gingeri]